MKSWLSRGFSGTTCCPRTRKTESTVEQGLTYTVAQMAEAAARGRAISSANCALMPNQGSVNPDWDVPLEFRRGVDIADIYQSQVEARKKIRTFGIEARKHKSE